MTILETAEQILGSDNSTFIFKNENITFLKGNAYRIYGRSGLGKSTLLRALYGIWRDTKGTIDYGCTPNQIYSMPQEQRFILDTLLKNITHPKAVQEQFAGSAAENNLHEMMHTLDLNMHIGNLNEIKNWEEKLSYGEKKRVSFLRLYFEIASIKNNDPSAPKILLLDEMTSGLDGVNANILERLVCILRKDHPDLCVIFIKHTEKIDHKNLNKKQKEFLSRTKEHAAGLNNYQILNLANKQKTPMIFSKPKRWCSDKQAEDQEDEACFKRRCTIS